MDLLSRIRESNLNLREGDCGFAGFSANQERVMTVMDVIRGTSCSDRDLRVSPLTEFSRSIAP